VRKLAIDIVLISLLLGDAAFAADLEPPRPAASSSSYSWTGIYIGAQGGGVPAFGWGRSNETFLLIPNSATFQGSQQYDISGGIAGGVVGANYQFSSIVIGIQGELNWAHLSGSSNIINVGPPNLGDTYNTIIKNYESAKGRIGYARDQIFFYIDGGGVWARVLHSYNLPATVGAAASSLAITNNESGWTAGAGIEYGFTPNLSGLIQYNFVHVGTGSLQYTAPIPGNRSTWTESFNVIKVGLNYRFNWSAP
jgi:outer membrane immunogenic protein